MIRDLGPYTRRPQKLNAPLMAMLLNGVHDRTGGRVFVVQVGAGTGETGLPLLSRFKDDGWSGLLIEPLPQNFAQLDALHADSERVAVLNLGISDISATLPLHHVTPEATARMRRAPRGASLIRDRIAVEGVSEDDMSSVDVPFLRLDTVLSELGIEKADLLVVNAGGHEEQVLRGVDVSALGPMVVLVHTQPDTRADDGCIAALTSLGYLPFRLGNWLACLAEGRLAVPLEELLTFLQKGLGAAPQDDTE